jgi:hypothetical protein
MVRNYALCHVNALLYLAVSSPVRASPNGARLTCRAAPTIPASNQRFPLLWICSLWLGKVRAFVPALLALTVTVSQGT